MVSVIIPNFNHSCFLKERINSVLNQTFQDFEIIILDDCSTDNSRNIIEQYSSNHKVSRVIFNDKNSGSAFKQWQKGFSFARGEYVWIAESDDWCDNRFLEILVQAMEQYPDCSVAFAQSVCVDENGRIKWETHFAGPSRPVDGREFISDYMLYKNTILNASMAIFRRRCLNSVSNDYTIFTYCGDWIFWIELALQGNVFIYNRSLNFFRKHRHDVTNAALSSGLNIQEESTLIQLLGDRNIISNKMKRVLLHRCFGKFHSKRVTYSNLQSKAIWNSFLHLFNSRRAFLLFLAEWKIKNTYRAFRKYFIHANS